MNINYINKIRQTDPALDITSIAKRIEAFHALVLKWNQRYHLVSQGDAGKLWDHSADSLSLCGGLHGEKSGNWLDIGSGGGFPAIPLAIALPDVQFTLLERKSNKCGFLEIARNQLGLGNLHVVEGLFPQSVAGVVDFVSARAVEKPETLADGLEALVRDGAVFMCQNKVLQGRFQGTFHVELIVDNWSQQGLRRGNLWRISDGQS